MCRWDLSPAILMLFPADWDCKSPPPWLLHEKNWHMVLAAPSLTDSGPGRPRGSRAPETPMGRKTKGEGAEVLVLYGLYPEQPLSRTWGVQPKELCQVRRALHFSFSLFHIFLVEPEEQLESPPSLGYAFKGYWKSTYLGQESSLSSMTMVVGVSEWESRDRE